MGDHHFVTTFILMGIVFVAAQVSLGYLVWKYREGGSSQKVVYTHGNPLLEILWTVLTAILFIGLNLMSSSIWASERFRPAESNAVRVEVTGMQFAWYFRYPGPDGKFGPTRPAPKTHPRAGKGRSALTQRIPHPRTILL